MNSRYSMPGIAKSRRTARPQRTLGTGDRCNAAVTGNREAARAALLGASLDRQWPAGVRRRSSPLLAARASTSSRFAVVRSWRAKWENLLAGGRRENPGRTTPPCPSARDRIIAADAARP